MNKTASIKITLALSLAALLITSACVPARAGILRYFMRGGSQQLALGGAPLLDTGTSDFDIGQPALDTGRPDNALRFTFEYEEIARIKENGVLTSNVSARNAQRELVFTKRAPGRSFTLLVNAQDVNSSSDDVKDGSYIATHGSVDSASFGMRFGKLAIGAGRVSDTSAVSGFSDYLRTEIFNSTLPPVISAPVEKPDDFVEFAVFPRKDLQLFYKKVWGREDAALSAGGTATTTGAWLLTMPFSLGGGGDSFGATARIARKWMLTIVATRNSYSGADSARLDYSNGFGTYDPFGLYKTAARTRSAGFEFAWSKSAAATLLFGASRERFAGVYDGEFVSVPTGYYDVDAFLDFRPTLYHVGYEKKGAFYGVTYRAGFQFGPMHPDGAATVSGASCPFLIICKPASNDERDLPYSSLTQRALTTGFAYAIGDFTLSYSVGQMFPRAVEKPDENIAGGPVEGAGVQAKGESGYGGLLQVLSFDYEF